MSAEYDEIKIIKECRRGSEEAFRKLVNAYQERAYWIAYNILSDHGIAQDITQEAFIRVFRSIRTFDIKKKFYTWFYQIVINLCIDYLRKVARDKEITFDDMTDIPEPREEPSDLAERKESAKDIREALAMMPAKYKTVIVLRDIEGFSTDEVAEITGCEPATVRWRLHRARKLFRYVWTMGPKRLAETDIKKL
jgi:RNA polymerase sigma-70 factor (ECF subfamily)